MTVPEAPGSLIVLAVPDFLPTLGGTSRQAANLARALGARGFEVIVLTQHIDPSWPQTEMIDGIRVVRLGPSARTGIAMKRFVINVAVWTLARRGSITIFHAIMYPDLAVASTAVGLGNVTVHTWAGLGDATDTLSQGAPSWLKRALAALRRRALRPVHHIVLTPAIEQELFDVGCHNNISVIPTPVDTTRFTPPAPEQRAAARRALGVGPDTIVFVFAGHLRQLKRVDALIDAFKLVVDQLQAESASARVRLFIAGDSRGSLDDQTAALHQQVSRLGLSNDCTFLGAVSDIVPLLHAADAMVLPSDREGLSNSLLEALSCAVPCIAPPSAGGDQVLTEHSGIVPRDNTPTELAAAMLQITDPVVRDRLRAGARPTALAYDVEHIIIQHVWCYANIRAHVHG